MYSESVFIQKPKFSWGFLAHLGFNLFADPVRDANGVPCMVQDAAQHSAEDHLRFDTDLWHETTKALADAGCNLVVIDIGEGYCFESHPEIACRGAWTRDVLQEEIFNLRMLGIEAIPKLNFSACRDAWMGEYGRMVSTSAYYRFCEDVIGEICEVFGRPRLFHLGMDEETVESQRLYNTVVIRQGEQWWYDLNFLARTAMRCGARPWIWADGVRRREAELVRRTPRDILLSYRWQTGGEAEEALNCRALAALADAGFEQIPAAGAAESYGALDALCGYAAEHLRGELLCGFLQTVWKPMMRRYADAQTDAIAALSAARAAWER